MLRSAYFQALFCRIFLLWICSTLSLLVMAQGECIGGMIDGTWPCHNVELLSHVPNVMTGEQNANDLWGWTDPVDGREYVLLGKRNGTWFVDVTEPKQPRVVGKLATVGLANSLWRDVKVVGDYMVVVSEVVNSRLQVFDLTRLRDHTATGPAITFSTDTVLGGFSKAHNLAAAPDEPLAFVCGANGTGGLLVYDFADTSAPTLAGSWTEAYVHDAHIIRYEGPDTLYQGKLMAAASCASDFRILDVSDPGDIQQVSSATHQPHGYLHQGWFSDDHRYFFLGDETDETNDLVSGTTTYVWDVQDLDSPLLLGAVDLGTEGTDHNLYARGNWLFQSNYNDGLRAQMFSPESDELLQEMAFFDTQPELSNPGFTGSWSNYPFFNSGTIAVSDQTQGLFLVRTQFMRGWPELVAVCPSDTVHLLLEVDSCIAGPVSVLVPDGVQWISTDSLPGPGIWPLDLAGFDWNDMQGMTLRVESDGLIHAYDVFVDITEDAAHYPDLDGDGYGTFDGAVFGCNPGPGYAHVGGDCNDLDAGIHPGLIDPCDGIDNDCDQSIDEDGISIPFYLDIDGDGIAGPQEFASCTPPSYAYLEPGVDCNDLDATMYPGAPPTLAGVDNDCNGYVLGMEQLGGGCPGDLNGDLTVTIQDLLEFLNFFGSSGFLEADLNFDQHVGVADLLLMLGYLGVEC